MDKNFCLTLYFRKCTSYYCDFWYTCKMMISLAFCIIISKFWFFRFLGGWKGKNWTKIAYFSLLLRNCRSYHQDYWYTVVKNCISRCFSLFFLEKWNIVNTIVFFNWHTLTVSLMNICFWSSSVNAISKRNSDVCPTFFTCVIFNYYIKVDHSLLGWRISETRMWKPFFVWLVKKHLRY